MGWIKTTEIAGIRSGPIDQTATRSYRRRFRVHVDSSTDGAIVARTAPGIPRLFEPYILPSGETDMGALVIKIEPQQTENPWLWEVEVDYSSQTVDPLKFAEDPLLRPAEFSWSFESIKKAFTKDVRTGDPVVNAAREPFDPPPERDYDRLVLVHVRNEAAFDPIDDALVWKNRLNDKPWYDGKFDSETVLLADIRAVETTENNFTYDRVSRVFKIDPEGWKKEYLNQGYYEVTAGGQRRVLLDDSGRPLSAPALLAADGSKLAIGGTPVYLSFDQFENKDFDPLNIP